MDAQRVGTAFGSRDAILTRIGRAALHAGFPKLGDSQFIDQQMSLEAPDHPNPGPYAAGVAGRPLQCLFPGRAGHVPAVPVAVRAGSGNPAGREGGATHSGARGPARRLHIGGGGGSGGGGGGGSSCRPRARPICLTDMCITGEKSWAVYKAVADPLDGPPITSVDPTQELTISEIVSREIDPVLFIHLPTTDDLPALSCTTEHLEIVKYLTQSITSWSN